MGIQKRDKGLLHFTQKIVGELPFLLQQNCLHIKEHFLRKF